MTWVEARLKPDAEPRDLYDWLEETPEAFHHFWDEPWHPGAYVVRIFGGPAELGDCPAISYLALWDHRPDVQLYGEKRAWWAFQLFEAGSMLSLEDDRWERGKFVHCFLNSHGMSVRDEFFWALRFAWGRATLYPRLWWRSR